MVITAEDYLRTSRGFVSRQEAMDLAAAEWDKQQKRLVQMMEEQQAVIDAARQRLSDLTSNAYDAYWGSIPLTKVDRCRARTDTGVGEIVVDLIVGKSPIKVSGQDFQQEDRRQQQVHSLYTGRDGNWGCVLVLYERNLFPSDDGAPYFDAHMTLVSE